MYSPARRDPCQAFPAGSCPPQIHVLYSRTPGDNPKNECSALNRRPGAFRLAICVLLACAAARAGALSPRRARSALAHARKQAEKGNAAEAIAELSALLESNPGCVEAHLLLIDLRGRSARAVVLREYELKLEEEPTSALLHFCVGCAASAPGRKLQHYRKAVELDPGLFHAQLELGRLCRSEAVDDLAASRRALEAAAALRPEALSPNSRHHTLSSSVLWRSRSWSQRPPGG